MVVKASKRYMRGLLGFWTFTAREAGQGCLRQISKFGAFHFGLPGSGLMNLRLKGADGLGVEVWGSGLELRFKLR